MFEWFFGLPEGARAWLTLAGIAVAALLVHAVIYHIAGVLGSRYSRLLVLDGLLLRHSRSPTRLLLPAAAARLALPYVENAFRPEVRAILTHLFAPILNLQRRVDADPPYPHRR